MLRTLPFMKLLRRLAFSLRSSVRAPLQARLAHDLARGSSFRGSSWRGVLGGVVVLTCLGCGPAAATVAPPAVAQARPSAEQTDAAGAKPQATGVEPSDPAPGVIAAPPKPVNPARQTLRNKVLDAAKHAGMPPELADAVTTVESNYNSGAIGGVGEIGLMQVLPSTARMLGFSGTLAELSDPDTNIRYGVRYLSQAWRLSGGDICTTVMKYRAGHGESRFSHRSVAYCIRVRGHLAGIGYKVTGEVPLATFGEAAGVRTAGKPGRRVAGRRSRYNWKAADARMNAISAKVSSAALIISR